jgi:signal transduction histidine kinase
VSDGAKIAFRAASRAGRPARGVPKLVTRFYGTAKARRGRTGGLRQGLYVAKGLVDAHGGQIWVESVPGRETTFTFTPPE